MICKKCLRVLTDPLSPTLFMFEPLVISSARFYSFNLHNRFYKCAICYCNFRMTRLSVPSPIFPGKSSCAEPSAVPSISDPSTAPCYCFAICHVRSPFSLSSCASNPLTLTFIFFSFRENEVDGRRLSTMLRSQANRVFAAPLFTKRVAVFTLLLLCAPALYLIIG